jgi:dTMP kinase
MRGKWIVLEGLDGAGTTTQSQALADFLRATLGEDRVFQTAEPTGGPFGQICRKALRGELPLEKETLALCFTADRSDHLRKPEGVLTHLERGDWVVMDRYLYSTLAYQDGLCRDWLLSLCSQFPRPDLLVFLETPVEECLARLSSRGKPVELFEKREALESISESYEWVLQAETPRTRLLRLDGTAPVDSLSHQIAEAVREWLPE